jgi:hypothetical protein
VLHIPSPVVHSPPQFFQVVGEECHSTSVPMNMVFAAATPKQQTQHYQVQQHQVQQYQQYQVQQQPQAQQPQAQQQQGSPGSVTLNFYVTTPEGRSRQLTPSPSPPSPPPPQTWQLNHQFQLQQLQTPQPSRPQSAQPELHHPRPVGPSQTPVTLNFNQLHPPTPSR